MDTLKKNIGNLLDSFIKEQMSIPLTSWAWVTFKNAVMGEIESAIERVEKKEKEDASKV